MQKMSLDMELPLGLGLAMAQRPEAMERFAALGEADRRTIIDRARNARTRQEMRDCIETLMTLG